LQNFSEPGGGSQTLTVVVFVQLVNTISGGFQTGNEHLRASLLDQNGQRSVDACAG